MTIDNVNGQQTRPLGDVARFIRGVTFKPDELVQPGSDGAVVCMRTKNVQADLDDSDLIAVPRQVVKRREQYLQETDILVSTANSWGLVGKCSWVPRLEYDATAGGFISILRADPQKVHPRYLYFWFSSPRTQHSVRHCGRQTTNISNMSYDRCLSLEIPLPSHAEQRRIAEILDKADTIRRRRATVDRTLLDFPRRLFFEMFGDVVFNDRAWQQSAVADAGEVQLGRQRAPKYQTGKFTRPYMRVANVFDDRIDLTDVLSMDFDERDFNTYRLESGDILLNEGQSTELVGRPAMWQNEMPDCCFQNTLIRFRANPDVTNPEFALAVFREYLHRGAFARISSKTSNVAHLGAGRFAAMPFPLPPREDQDKFAAARKKLRCMASTAQRACQESDDLFASLVYRAFRG